MKKKTLKDKQIMEKFKVYDIGFLFDGSELPIELLSKHLNKWAKKGYTHIAIQHSENYDLEYPLIFEPFRFKEEKTKK